MALPRPKVYIRIKRLLDIVVVGILVVLLLPLSIMIAGVIRFKLGKPILFRQERSGLQGRSFTMIKFRTLTEDKSSECLPLSDEARMTPLGRILRKSSLDEFPSLLNVMRGDMSLVGPRPFLATYLDRYTEREMERHKVRPGITGWAQVNGRNAISWDERLSLDLWYVDNQSFLLDLRILLRTFHAVLRSRDVSAENHATMLEFRPKDEQEHQ